MRKLLTFAGAATSLLLLSAPVFAHHGFAGRYDEDHPVTVTGTVLELQFMNPHSFIIFENKDASGKSLRWQAELGSANLLAREGWRRSGAARGLLNVVENSDFRTVFVAAPFRAARGVNERPA